MLVDCVDAKESTRASVSLVECARDNCAATVHYSPVGQLHISISITIITKKYDMIWYRNYEIGPK